VLTDVEGTDLLSEDNLSDINDIAAVLKLWFRELPEPLLTWELYHQFIDVASESPQIQSLYLLSFEANDCGNSQRLKTIDYDISDYTNE
jgi:hypothetical protein